MRATKTLLHIPWLSEMQYKAFNFIICFAFLYIIYTVLQGLDYTTITEPTIIPGDSCPKKIVTILDSGGQLGNKMMDYATVYVVARELKDHVGFSDSGRDYLSKIFKHISMYDLDEECKKKKKGLGPQFWNMYIGDQFKELVYNRSSTPQDVTTFSFTHDNVLMPYYQWVPILYPKYLDELRHAFQFRDHILAKAQTTLELVRRLYDGREKPVLVVGVHIRRGDYKMHLDGLYHMQLLGPEFYVKGMEYFQRKYAEKYLVIFLAVSNDVNWVRTHIHFEHFYIVSKDKDTDMALLSLCNHTVTDYGTFGFWPSLMHGGEHYTTNIYEDFIVAMMYQMKGWTVVNYTTPLKTSNNSEEWLKQWARPEEPYTITKETFLSENEQELVAKFRSPP
uniref:L-Fucosyltransferase n=1 Tax=Cacopsylla melanoneura TaxID=428564 RepID=A0A8D8VD38_9HEMI